MRVFIPSAPLQTDGREEDYNSQTHMSPLLCFSFQRREKGTVGRELIFFRMRPGDEELISEALWPNFQEDHATATEGYIC